MKEKTLSQLGFLFLMLGIYFMVQSNGSNSRTLLVASLIFFYAGLVLFICGMIKGNAER